MQQINNLVKYISLTIATNACIGHSIWSFGILIKDVFLQICCGVKNIAKFDLHSRAQMVFVYDINMQSSPEHSISFFIDPECVIE